MTTTKRIIELIIEVNDDDAASVILPPLAEMATNIANGAADHIDRISLTVDREEVTT